MTRWDEAQAPLRCQLCGSDGWVECIDDRRHARSCKVRGTRYGDTGDCVCHAVVPCRCTAGKRATEVAGRIHAANDRALADAGTQPPDTRKDGAA